MEVIKLIEQAEQRCKTNGSRLTVKRKQVLSLLLSSDKALSAYELVKAYKAETGKTLPAMSVYRILEFLEREHLAHRLELANKYVACKQINSKHEHVVSQFLICGQCQKVKEISIESSAMTELKKSVKNAGFYLTSPQLEMHCICEDCTVDSV